jgi:hypothetical protein
MERLFKYFVKSKLTNVVKPILAESPWHARSKALSFFELHELKDLQLLYINDAKKR